MNGFDDNRKYATSLTTDACSLKTEPEWLTTEEAAQYLRVTAQSVLDMTSRGKITYYKFFGRNRYRLDDLRKMLLTNKRGGINGN